MVVSTGLEPVTSPMSRERATNCANRPEEKIKRDNNVILQKPRRQESGYLELSGKAAQK